MGMESFELKSDCYQHVSSLNKDISIICGKLIIVKLYSVQTHFQLRKVSYLKYWKTTKNNGMKIL